MALNWWRKLQLKTHKRRKTHVLLGVLQARKNGQKNWRSPGWLGLPNRLVSALSPTYVGQDVFIHRLKQEMGIWARGHSITLVVRQTQEGCCWYTASWSISFLFNIITRSRHYMPCIHRWMNRDDQLYMKQTNKNHQTFEEKTVL